MKIQKIPGLIKFMNRVIVKIGGKKKTITITNNSKISVNKKEYDFELVHLHSSIYLLKVNNKFFKIDLLKINNEKYVLSVNGEKFISSYKSLLKEKTEKLIAKKNFNNDTKILTAPMPGMVLEIKIKAGDRINKGDNLLILKAMKMENTIKSPFTGIIKEIFVQKNSPVEKDTKLLSIV